MTCRYFIALAVASLLAVSVAADAKIKFDKNFRFPADRPATIIVFRPDVQVGSMGVGGVEEANADWTSTARDKLLHEIEAQQRASGNTVIFLAEQEGDKAKLVADYQALFRVVAGAVAQHKMIPGANLPTKQDRFDWTLGPGAAQLGTLAGGDYALFVNTHDAYGTAGRKVMQIFAAGLLGVGMQAGIHVSYAALVDLKTGDLVWFNLDGSSGGDPRTDVGAIKRMGQLFKSFPAGKPAIDAKTGVKASAP